MKTTYRNTDTNEPIRIYERQPTGRMLPCPGDAHSNPYIDNCMICAPRWGEVPEYAPTDLDAAKREGLVVRSINNTPGAPPSMTNRAEVIRTNGTQPSEPERIRVLGLLAADDAEPFT